MIITIKGKKYDITGLIIRLLIILSAVILIFCKTGEKELYGASWTESSWQEEIESWEE